jgi:alpha-L-fucosidase
MVDLIHELQPRCLINDRLGVPGDFGSPEQRIPGSQPDRLFEVCMSLNGHWSYNQNDHRWKEPKVVVRNLVDVVSKGGNYLLGIGPTAEGILPPEAVTVLEEAGQWLKINSASIYGSEASPFPRLTFDGRCTRKAGTLYLHVFTWPKDGQLTVAITNPVKRAYLLADPGQATLKVNVSEGGATIAIPAAAPDPIDTVIAVEIEGELKLAAAP